MKRLSLLSMCLVISTVVAFSGQSAQAFDGVNLLRNPGFEQGGETPKGWQGVSVSGQAKFVWEKDKSNSDKKSVSVSCRPGEKAMWRQVVNVSAGKVYAYAGYVGFENIKRPGRCNLQLVFRDSQNKVIKLINYPHHTQSRDFSLDFPHKLKVRAPKDAEKVEVNLYLEGPGKAMFDDIFFALAPTGAISGTVTSGGKPLKGVRVHFWGDNWGKVDEAFTDANGKYYIGYVPVTFPRYIVLASKDGYKTLPKGEIAIETGRETVVDFDLVKGSDPDDLRVKFGSLVLERYVPGNKFPEGAKIPPDASGYDKKLRPFLQPDECIVSDNPVIIAKAKWFRDSLPVEDRNDTRKVVWEIHKWVSQNIDHDGVFAVPGSGLDQPFKDETSGIWQTISGNRGWCWGRSFYDWCYRGDEVLEEKCAICIEHAWMCAAMFRALNIPARSTVGSYEVWAQTPDGNGCWIHASTTGGRTNYRERGIIGASFEGGPPEGRFAVLSRPVLQEDWDARNPGLWREDHPWTSRNYKGNDAGLKEALDDLKHFEATGQDRSRHRPVDHSQRNAATQVNRKTDKYWYYINYSDTTVNLFTMGDQRILKTRFPIVSGSDEYNHHEFTGNTAYWTNHPECIKRTWIEEIKNPPAEGFERWYYIEFDLTPLL